jgi:NAD(P)H-hydrate epimerase
LYSLTAVLATSTDGLFMDDQFARIPLLSRQQVRAVDARAIEHYGMLGVVLMENAGRGAAERIDTILRQHPAIAPSSVAILCGKGNNAGDGYVIARHLQLLGHHVSIIQCSPAEELGGDALHFWRVAQASEIPTYQLHPVQSDSTQGSSLYFGQLQLWLSNCRAIIDCLLGTGASGELRQPYAAAVDIANSQDAQNAQNVIRIAIDVPTGLDCDTGQAGQHCFRAMHTCTFVAAKPGLVAPAARDYVGQLHVLGIGVPQKLLSEFGI